MSTRFWQSPWVSGHQLFSYPLADVIADTAEEARAFAEEAGLLNPDPRVKCEALFDSAAAQMRLDVFGKPEAFDAMMRGDER